jgi:pimeloyl-ACP methyl ester carboxylesterase
MDKNPAMWTRTEGHGQNIIFLHGWMMDHRDEVRTYEPIFDGLSGWCRHYVDLPGMGRSLARADIHDMDGMLDAVLGAIEALAGGGRFLLGGTSAGGYLARGVLARLGNRIDGLLLRAPLIVPADRDRDVDPIRPVLVDPDAARLIPDTERLTIGEILVQTPSYISAIRQKTREAVAPAMAAADTAFLAPIRQDERRYRFSFDPDEAEVLSARPTLIVTGRHDASVGYRDAWRIVEKFPRATYVVLDRAEHGLPIDQQAVFAALVRDWLDRVADDTSTKS